MLKLVGVKRSDVGLLHQKALPVEQKIVVVHHVSLALALHVDHVNALDRLGQRFTVWITTCDDILDWTVSVVGKADDVLQDFCLREATSFRVNPCFVNAGSKEIS